MDYSDKEDVNALLYTSTIVAKGEVYTFDVFKKTLSNRKLVREMVLSLENRMSVLAQFQNKRAGTDKINSDTTPGDDRQYRVNAYHVRSGCYICIGGNGVV